MMKSMKLLEERAETAKASLEHEVAALYAEFHKCSDPVKKSAIKKSIDEMIASVERKKGETTIRVKKD